MTEGISFMIDYNLTNIKYMRKKLHHVSKFTHALKDAQASLEQLRTYNKGKLLVDLQMPQSDKAKKLFELLNSLTFAEDHDGLWLVRWGNIKLAYKLMLEIKDEFKKPYAALGELDYLMGSARLILNPPVCLVPGSPKKTYTLATFVEGAQTPALTATNC